MQVEGLASENIERNNAPPLNNFKELKIKFVKHY